MEMAEMVKSDSSMAEMVKSDSSMASHSPSSNIQSPSSSTLPKTLEMSSSMIRLWRPQAQRNLRNQWKKLSSLRHDCLSSFSAGKSHATSLVNSYQSIRYMDVTNLGVLSDMSNIRQKACCKLVKQLERNQSKLLSSYKAMVSVVIDMMNISRSMRCFLKATTGSPLMQFSSTSEDSNDTGDGGGAPVFTLFPIRTFEGLAEELVEMFKLELILKRFLVVELFSVSSQKVELLSQLSWADELYHGEASDLIFCHLYSNEDTKPLLPRINGWKSGTSSVEFDKQPKDEVLQVYLTTWAAEVNVDTHRVEEIFAIVGEEMRTVFS